MKRTLFVALCSVAFSWGGVETPSAVSFGTGDSRALHRSPSPEFSALPLSEQPLMQPSPTAGQPQNSNAIQTFPLFNQITYLTTQTFYSTILYGAALPELLQSDSEITRAAVMLSIPVSFGVHYYLSHLRPINDATVVGTTLAPVATWLALLGIGALFFPDLSGDDPLFWAAIASYPVGLWGGFQLGRFYRNDPGRISQFVVGAAAGGIASLCLSLSLQELFDRSSDRAEIAAVLLGAGVGIWATARWPQQPLGTGSGLATLNRMALGMGTFLYLGTVFGEYIGGMSLPAAFLLSSGAVAATYVESLLFQIDQKDSFQRAFYTLLGTGAGTITGVALATIAQFEEAAPLLGVVLASSYGGYLLTRHLTRSLQGDGEVKTASQNGEWNLSLVPLPELALTGASNDPYLRASFLRLTKGF